MVVSPPKRQQRGATAAAAPGWGAFAYFAGQVVVFFFPLLAFSWELSLVTWLAPRTVPGAGQGRVGGGDSQPFGSLHKIKIKAKVRLLPVTRR